MGPRFWPSWLAERADSGRSRAQLILRHPVGQQAEWEGPKVLHEVMDAKRHL